MDCDSPYMLLVTAVKKERQIPMTVEQRKLWGLDLLNQPRSDIPAVTHIDYSARVQTVSRDVNPDYCDLIREFEKLTGCPVVVNTSLSVGKASGSASRSAPSFMRVTKNASCAVRRPNRD